MTRPSTLSTETSEFLMVCSDQPGGNFAVLSEGSSEKAVCTQG
jgi:hypothetical protein